MSHGERAPEAVAARGPRLPVLLALLSSLWAGGAGARPLPADLPGGPSRVVLSVSDEPAPFTRRGAGVAGDDGEALRQRWRLVSPEGEWRRQVLDAWREARPGTLSQTAVVRYRGDPQALGSLTAAGQGADFVVDVRTTAWGLQAAADGTPRWRLQLGATARIVDVRASQVLADADCRWAPDGPGRWRSLADWEASDARALREALAEGTRACAATLRRALLGVGGVAPALAEAGADAPARVAGPVAPVASAAAAASSSGAGSVGALSPAAVSAALAAAGPLRLPSSDVPLERMSAAEVMAVLAAAQAAQRVAATEPVAPPPSRRPAMAPADWVKPAATSPLTPGMMSGHTWTYPHPRDPERFGDIVLRFSEKGVDLRNRTSHTQGQWYVGDDVLCVVADKGWGTFCMVRTEEQGQARVQFPKGRSVPLQVQ